MKRVAIINDTSKVGLGGHCTQSAFNGLPGVEVTALADPNPENIRARLDEVGAKRHYSDYRAMLDQEKPDIALLCSRLPGDHLPQIEAAARAGCHILCEKPMCTDLAEGDRILALSKKYGVRIAVAHLARYVRVFRIMKEMIHSGAIGTPLTFYGRGKEDERGGGEDLVVLGTHILDLGCYLFGRAQSVFADVSVDGRALRATDRSVTKEPLGAVAGDSLMAFLQFPGNVRGIFESRRGLFRKGSQVRMGVTVAGTEGCLSVRYDRDRHLRISRSVYPPEDESAYGIVPLPPLPEIPGAAPLVIPEHGPVEAKYFAEGNRFAAWDLIRAIGEHRSPAASAEDAVFTLEMINGIYRSALEGKKIPLPLSDRSNPLT